MKEKYIKINKKINELYDYCIEKSSGNTYITERQRKKINERRGDVNNKLKICRICMEKNMLRYLGYLIIYVNKFKNPSSSTIIIEVKDLLKYVVPMCYQKTKEDRRQFHIDFTDKINMMVNLRYSIQNNHRIKTKWKGGVEFKIIDLINIGRKPNGIIENFIGDVHMMFLASVPEILKIPACF